MARTGSQDMTLDEPPQTVASSRLEGEARHFVPRAEQLLGSAKADCMPSKNQVLSVADCPSRLLLDQIADKWSVLVLAALKDGPQRFNMLRRRLEGITQKALTQTLRRLERNGIIERRVLPGSPVAVEYEITPLGRTLREPFLALYTWTVDHLHEVEHARQTFDRQSGRGAGDD